MLFDLICQSPELSNVENINLDRLVVSFGETAVLMSSKINCAFRILSLLSRLPSHHPSIHFQSSF
jgi:hypothetical protein